jgi:hypothetical protein
MKLIKNWLSVVIIMTLAFNVGAHLPTGSKGKPLQNVVPKASFRVQCAPAKSQTDIEVNNVRARLQGGGDIWWDLKDGKYIVPKVSGDVKPVSSIFAGGIWIGGVTDGGSNIKTACTTYRTSGNDWFPGPLDQTRGGITGADTCADWDKHFRVTGADLSQFRAAYAKAKAEGSVDAGGRVTDPTFFDAIPRNLKGWPAKGNPYFAQIWNFKLSNDVDYLANFWENPENANGIYDPMEGDYPSIYVKNCESGPQTADEMIFWVYNDEGGGATHSNSKGSAIRMEVQVQAFAYATNDELNNMTFMHYRLINRAPDVIDSVFFAMWTDPDLGCYQDDYVGCDTTRGPNGNPRNLMYVYNQDDADGNPGTTCPGGVNTYGTNVPILGVDYFRGPRDPRKLAKNPVTGLLEPKELGMSSFIYYNNQQVGTPAAATTDPNQVADYYRYLNAVWKDGTPLTGGGSGYKTTFDPKEVTKYALPGDPDNKNSWSMVNANLPFGDRRTLQASGPFPLKPGAINELIVGVPWVPSQGGGAVSLTDIRSADDIAQDLFDNCFRLLDGPDAPDMEVIELNREIILTLSNSNQSNNFGEQYGKSSVLPLKQERPSGWYNNPKNPDPFYTFEGYKIYQLQGPEVNYTKSLVDEGSDKIKLVAQVDVQNGVSKIFNWTSVPDPFNTSSPAYSPVLQVDGTNTGVKHTFKVNKDLFAKSDNKSLINHKKYYFVAVAYGHNNFDNFDKKGATGQKKAYIEGRKNAEGTQIKTYVVIPRPIVDRTLKANYGDGAVITRLDGVGVGGNFVDISDETRRTILDGSFKGEITYKAGKGPIGINIYNPLEVKDGDYELSMTDKTPTDDKLDVSARWELKKVGQTNKIVSEQTIERLNEQIIKEYGFSISIAQTKDLGDEPDKQANNGAIGSEIIYADPTKPLWFDAIADEADSGFDFVTNQPLEDLGIVDPKKKLSTSFVDGKFVPYSICANKQKSTGGNPPILTPLASPAWHNSNNGNFYATKKGNLNLSNVNNVDIVFTSDKSKWSRCMVVETNNKKYTDAGLISIDNTANMSLRTGKSIGTDKDPDAASDGTTGKSWFPGYAIDVETGRRLTIFFGENSGYDLTGNPLLTSAYRFSQTPTGGDMIWNPTADAIAPNITLPGQQPLPPNDANLVAGCGHYIYVTDLPYADWKIGYDALIAQPKGQQQIVRNIRWASMPVLATGTKLLSYDKGLIPNDLTVKLRVDNSYQVATGTGANNSYPTYKFSLKGKQYTNLESEAEIKSELDAIKVIPNPYYAYSAYETSQFTNTVKIANLPAKCDITIYSLDGRFIRKYRRDEVEGFKADNPGIRQILPALEWDLKNAKGIPIASGTYILHINAPGIGEKTVKWFGVMRPFDPSGL